MKNLVNSVLIVLVTYTGVWAQQGRPPMERIHAAKMAYITDRLHLSVEQSSNFIPLFNEYDREIRSTRERFFSKYRGVNPAKSNNTIALQAIDDNLDYQQQVIEIKRKYNQRFLKIISPQQLSDLYKSEREFKQILMQRLKQQHNGGGRFNRGNGY